MADGVAQDDIWFNLLARKSISSEIFLCSYGSPKLSNVHQGQRFTFSSPVPAISDLAVTKAFGQSTRVDHRGCSIKHTCISCIS